MFKNADCTLYLCNANGGFDKYVVKDVYWHDNRGSTTTKNGIQSADNVTVYFYSDNVKPHSVGKDLLIKGIAEFEFNNTTSQTVSQSMKSFREQHPDFVTVVSVNDYMFGGLPHIEIIAR